jgi:VCBS repeat-containing protein
MRFFKAAAVSLVVLSLSCLKHDNPFDINDPHYDPPEAYIDSSSAISGDSTALESVALTISGNIPEVEVRWRLDSLQWPSWQAQGKATVGGYGPGLHTITVQGRYGEGGEIVDTAISFVKVNAPSLAPDTASLLDDSLVAVGAGTLCTLRVNADGSGKLMYFWLRGTVIVDSTSGTMLVIGPFAAKDSGSYFALVRNKWGVAVSDTVFLRYVPPVNNAPVAVRDSFFVAEDNTLTIAAAQSILKNDTDKDRDTLSAVMIDSTRNGALSLSGDGTFTYHPNKDYFGADSFTYKARDTKAALSAIMTVKITVTPVNDAPVVAKNDHITLNEGQKVTIASSKVAVTDVDNAPSLLEYAFKRPPAHGAVLVADTSLDGAGTLTQKNIDDGVVVYQHDGGETTKDTAIFSISDGSGGLIDSVRVVFDIAPVNDAPYFAAKLDLAVVEGGSKTLSSATLQVKDNDNTPVELVYTIVSDVIHGQVHKSGTTLDAGATFTQQDIDSGKIVYQHDKSNTTRDSLSFSVSDGTGGAIAPIWLIIRIGAVDDPPGAIDQGGSTSEDTPLNITLTANDPEGMAISGWEISLQPKHGVLTGSGATRAYTPAQNYFGPDTFLFRANDGVNWSDTGVIAISVLPVNDAPVWKQSIVELSGKEGKSISLDLNAVFDKDPEGDGVTFSKKSGVGALSGHTWAWTPGFTAAATSPASIVIAATDNGSPFKTADVTLSITVTDSMCRLTTSVAIGSGSITTSGTTFDPGAVVQITANPAADYVFKEWSGDVPNTSQTVATVAITMNGDKSVAATFVKAIETVTLNIGESYVHGSIYAKGYFFLSTRTEPAKLLRLNADNLADYRVINFSSGHNYADQLVYVQSKDKIYVVFSDAYTTMVAEVDPITMAYTEEIISDNKQGTVRVGILGGHSMCADENNLYVLTCQFDTSKILKYSLSSMSSTPIAVCNIPPEYKYAHAIQYQEGTLYVSNGGYTPWIARVDAATLLISQIRSLKGSGFTDDFAINANYLFFGIEAGSHSDQSGQILRVDKNNLDLFYYFSTGAKGSDTTGYGACFGVQSFDGTIWAIFDTWPGTITKIDPVSLSFTNYALEKNDPNEIVYDGRRILVTYWDQNPGVVQAIAPEYFK